MADREGATQSSNPVYWRKCAEGPQSRAILLRFAADYDRLADRSVECLSRSPRPNRRVISLEKRESGHEGRARPDHHLAPKRDWAREYSANVSDRCPLRMDYYLLARDNLL
jgi:hypothetical protein